MAAKEEDDGALVDLLLVTMEADFTQGPCRVERGGLDGPEEPSSAWGLRLTQ